MTTLQLPADLQTRLDRHLDAVDDVLRRFGKSRTDRSAIVDELANQVIDMVSARAADREPTVDDLLAVLAEIDPPEAYARHSIDLPAVSTPFTFGDPPAEPRFNRATLYGLGWFAWMTLAGMLLFMLMVMRIEPPVYEYVAGPNGDIFNPRRHLIEHEVMAYQTWWGILLLVFIVLPGLLAPIGTTLLGWIGISQIKHSGGRQHGLGLAAFNGLVFILIAIAAAIACAFLIPTGLLVGVAAGRNPDFSREVFTYWMLGASAVAALLSLIVCFLVTRTAWRCMRQPLHGAQK